MDWRNAEDNYLHALSLGTHVSVSRRSGVYLTALGRCDEASHYLKAAQRIDSFPNRQKVVCAKFFHLACAV